MAAWKNKKRPCAASWGGPQARRCSTSIDGHHQQRVFRRYVGVPVKWVLCRYRLQQAALEIESHPGVDHADLAVRLGWYDQAHFINDFRTMLGSTPGEYAASHEVRKRSG
jgi:AraC-like DNA-binding protein